MSEHSLTNVLRVTPRAKPLPAEERRTAIVEVARPLFMEQGAQLTTRQVAEAAGIAEGTLFRVFPTKHELMCAVIDDVVDPTRVISAIGALHPSSLAEAVHDVLGVLNENVRTTSAFFAALHSSAGETPAPPRHLPPPQNAHWARISRVTGAIASLLSPFADDLTVSTSKAAGLVHTMALATMHPFLSVSRFEDIDEVTELMLHGFARPDTGRPEAARPDRQEI
ncbi:TetR/AcrR family transcriptional regulator [Aestuariimicrobium kwangyangense]|uniref:TetR/AcrR family transcriptional regulator n=1 Tax=Aestuariimicrobium kwangyangense TaxID=396389 RepID=UPI000A04FE70|nr:TetR/AcrR family transcriptional regulator [Aestuariimicrobium kwangyangense]